MTAGVLIEGADACDGRALRAALTRVTMTGVRLSDNQAQDAGALSNSGWLTLTDVNILRSRSTKGTAGASFGGVVEASGITVAENVADVGPGIGGISAGGTV